MSPILVGIMATISVEVFTVGIMATRNLLIEKGRKEGRKQGRKEMQDELAYQIRKASMNAFLQQAQKRETIPTPTPAAKPTNLPPLVIEGEFNEKGEIIGRCRGRA